MIDAGLAMVQSLQALADQTTNKVMRDVIRDVCTRVEGGDSFSEALQKHPLVFSRLYVCMVAAGEKGGLLAEIMSRLAVYLENTARLRKKVFSTIEAEWHRTAEALSHITGDKERLAHNTALARSIKHRFPYIDPLHHLQVELVRRWRAGQDDERVQTGIHISINGIAAGLRNTG